MDLRSGPRPDGAPELPSARRRDLGHDPLGPTPPPTAAREAHASPGVV
jgi:hypothetical protein